MHRHVRFLTLLRFGLLLVLLGPAVLAQQPPNPTAKIPTKGELEARLKALDALKDPAAKATAQEHYRQALQHLATLATLRKSSAEFQAMSDSAQQDLEAAKNRLADPPKAELELAASLEVSELDQKRIELEAELLQVQQERTRLSAELTRRQKRLLDIVEELESATKGLGEIRQQLGESPPANEPALLTQARVTLLQIREQVLQLQQQLLDAEQTAYKVTTELLPLQEKVAEQRIWLVEERLEQVGRLLAEGRESEAEKRVREARRQVEFVPRELRELALANLFLAEKNVEWLKRGKDIEAEVQNLQDKLADLQATHKRIRERVDTVGLTEAFGILLRRQRNHLLHMHQELRQIPSHHDSAQELQAELFRIEDDPLVGENPDTTAVRYLAENGIATETNKDKLTEQTRKLLTQRTLFQAETLSSGEALFRKIVTLESIEQSFEQEVAGFQSFIDQRILWIRSAGIFKGTDLAMAMSAFEAFLTAPAWKQAPHNLGQKFGRKPVVAILLIVFLITLGASRPLQNYWLVRTAAQAKDRKSFAFLPTVYASIATILRASLWPAVLYSLGWALFWQPTPELLCSAGSALMTTALFLFPLELLRQACQEGGLGEMHLGWPRSHCDFLCKRLVWAIPVSSILLVLLVTVQTQKNETWQHSLGRILGFAFLAILAWMGHRLFRRGDGLFGDTTVAHAKRHLYRPIWHLCSTIPPIALLLLSFVGYHFSAYQLLQNLLQTMSLAILLTFVNGLLFRWTRLRRRRLVHEAKQRHALPGGQATPESFEGIELQTEPALDLHEISGQNRHLIRTAIWLLALVGVSLIWMDVFPAFTILDKVTLWSFATEAGVTPVTLSDLFLATLVLVLVVVAVRNSAGLLSVLLLERMPLDAGARYAIETMVRYTISIIGFIVALNFLHVPWSQYRWLVAAATVGLGFGLQEIFANFISGIILLLERPIRVGDIVTIGETTGVVAKIRIRATTVTTLDHQDLIVPNKELVTGRILNWTLSDRMARIVIKVSVPYGTDPDKTRSLLLQVAREHPLPLDDPAPFVVLEKFGESALHFSLCCFLQDLEKRIGVIHELHSQIVRTLSDAGINIPFPQHDVHIVAQDSPPELSNQ